MQELIDQYHIMQEQLHALEERISEELCPEGYKYFIVYSVQGDFRSMTSANNLFTAERLCRYRYRHINPEFEEVQVYTNNPEIVESQFLQYITDEQANNPEDWKEAHDERVTERKHSKRKRRRRRRSSR